MKTDKELIDIVNKQESAFVFGHIDIKMIVDIAKEISSLLHSKQVPTYIMTVVNDTVVFAELLPGASKDNTMWARRKGNLALLLNKSSYRATLEFQMNGKDFSNRGLSLSEYALSGGAFPIKIGDMIVGYFAVSGMTQEEDHQVIVDGLSRYFGRNIESVID